MGEREGEKGGRGERNLFENVVISITRIIIDRRFKTLLFDEIKREGERGKEG